MSNSSIITLLSDLGTRDTSVTTTRTLLMDHVPDSTIIDISNNAAQYDLQQAAYLLLSAYKYFAKGTVHIIAIDVFAGDAPRMLVAEHEGYFFIAPDNGVLPLAFGANLGHTRLCFEFKKPYSFKDWMETAAKAILKLQAGNYTRYEACDVKQAPRVLQPRILPGGVECNILYIDRYENVVLDITRKQFEELVQDKPFTIRIMRVGDITSVSSNYNDVRHGDPLCRFNSAGFLEIAFNHAFAATSLGLGTFSTGNLRYQTIKILF